ncbi:MAG TPA: hypothetical protein VE172_15900 [Stackebrandtia sp.]|jgi:hypothetical protein|nr:hypothetical protein [Stackebrandtia sp.]
MPKHIQGVPIHPLLVHLPVVLIPLLALLMLAYVVIPGVRRHIGWAVLLATIAVPGLVYLTRQSGDVMKDEILHKLRASGVDVSSKVNAINIHDGYSKVIFWLTLVLVPITLLFMALERGRRSVAVRGNRSVAFPSAAAEESESDTVSLPERHGDDDPAGRGRTIVMIVLGLVMLGLIGVSTWYLYKAGHSGALMVWSGED